MKEAGEEDAVRGSFGVSAGRLLLLWLPTLVYVLAILFMATRPAPRLPRIAHIDKYLHALAYGALALLASRPLARSSFPYPMFLTLLLALGVGMADEGIQALGHTRTADFRDLLADVTGAVAVLIMLFLARRAAS